MPRLNEQAIRQHCHLTPYGGAIANVAVPYEPHTFEQAELDELGISRKQSVRFLSRIAYLQTHAHHRYELGTLVSLALNSGIHVAPRFTALAQKVHDRAHKEKGFCVAGPHTEEKDDAIRAALAAMKEGDPAPIPVRRPRFLEGARNDGGPAPGLDRLPETR